MFRCTILFLLAVLLLIWAQPAFAQAGYRPSAHANWNAWERRLARACRLLAEYRLRHQDDTADEECDPTVECVDVRQFGDVFCTASCEVTREGQLINLRVSSPSSDKKWDDLILGVVKQMDGMSVLRFPAGTSESLYHFEWTLGLSIYGSRRDDK